jgi:5'-nucleotidase
MWLRPGIQTDFSLTNTTGIRTDLVPGPVTIDQMYNIFPFDNAITKMSLSGVEVQELFDYIAQRSSGRGCDSQAQIAGARVVLNCSILLPYDQSQGNPGHATNIYIGTSSDRCQSDDDCPGKGPNQCDVLSGVCWQPIEPLASYQLATSDYLSHGGSGFLVLQRNTTQNDTFVEQRDALIDFIRGGFPCGADAQGQLKTCSTDDDCANVVPGEVFACACPESVIDGAQCVTGPSGCAGKGQCVLAQCRDDVAAFQRTACEAAPTTSIQNQCEQSLAPCVAGGETCKSLACVDQRLGNFSDNRIVMVQ